MHVETAIGPWKGVITDIVNQHNMSILNLEYVNQVMWTLNDSLTRMRHPDSSKPLKLCQYLSTWVTLDKCANTQNIQDVEIKNLNENDTSQ